MKNCTSTEFLESYVDTQIGESVEIKFNRLLKKHCFSYQISFDKDQHSNNLKII